MLSTIEDMSLHMKVGYRVRHTSTLRAVRVGLGGILGADYGETAAAVVDVLLWSLGSERADILYLPELRSDSPLYRAVESRAPRLRRHILARGKHWQLNVDRDPRDLLASWSPETKENVRRCRRRCCVNSDPAITHGGPA